MGNEKGKAITLSGNALQLIDLLLLRLHDKDSSCNESENILSSSSLSVRDVVPNYYCDILCLNH